MVDWIERLARERAGAPDRGRALDVAAGRGRHAVIAARAGFHTFAVDVRLDALRDARAAVAAAGGALRAWCADLTRHPLPESRFDVVLVSRYLQRDLFPSLQRALVPGGVLLCETFTIAQRAHGTGPTSPDHLLEPGELRSVADRDRWDVLFYEERREPSGIARLAARRRCAATARRSRPASA